MLPLFSPIVTLLHDLTPAALLPPAVVVVVVIVVVVMLAPCFCVVDVV